MMTAPDRAKKDDQVSLPPLRSHEILAFCRNIFGEKRFSHLYGFKSKATISRHLRNPDDDAFREDVSRDNFIDSIQATIRDLARLGHERIARNIVEILLLELPGYRLEAAAECRPDRDTVEEECLDDYPAVTEFHQAIRDGQSVEVVRYLYLKAKAELEETYELSVRRVLDKDRAA